MDQKTLYQKAEQAFNQAFEIAKQTVKVVSEKAGEAAQITKLLIEKASLEHRVTKQFAKIGSLVYEKARKDGGSVFLQDPDIQTLIESTEKLDGDLDRVEKELAKERKTQSP